MYIQGRRHKVRLFGSCVHWCFGMIIVTCPYCVYGSDLRYITIANWQAIIQLDSLKSSLKSKLLENAFLNSYNFDVRLKIVTHDFLNFSVIPRCKMKIYSQLITLTKSQNIKQFYKQKKIFFVWINSEPYLFQYFKSD